ncbi:hypothetical protein V2A60_010075 [Cordyceps javanica]
MSDELRDEIEAINSIYGEASLVPAGDQDQGGGGGDYILQLPGDAGSSLQLRFPSGYPETGGAPSVLGVQHSSGGVRGAGARDVRLFRAALGAVYQEGAVCLFDAVEDFSRRLEEQQQQQMEEADGAAAEDADADEGDRSQDQGVNRRRPRNDDDAEEEEELDGAALAALPPPPWTVSEPVVEGKSTFVARVAAVSSPAQARRYLAQLLAGDRRVRSATHNITAWRVRGAAGTGSGTGAGAGAKAGAKAVAVSYQDCDDDGEDAAGGRLLHLMQLMGLWDAMVVVTRWYGGVRLGPRRFALINAVARDAFVRAGMVPEGPGGGGGGSGGGKGKKR